MDCSSHESSGYLVDSSTPGFVRPHPTTIQRLGSVDLASPWNESLGNFASELLGVGLCPSPRSPNYEDLEFLCFWMLKPQRLQKKMPIHRLQQS
jgi:hypothetical protein